MRTRRYLILLGALFLPSAMKAVCPVAAVALTDGSGTKTSIPVGMNVLASAPAGWFGGSFTISNTGIAELSNYQQPGALPLAKNLSKMVTAKAPGFTGISGAGWATEAGDTNCALASTTLTVTALTDEVLVFDWNELINTTIGKQRTRYFEGDTDFNLPGTIQPVRYNQNRHSPIDFDHGTFQFRIAQGCQAVNDRWTWQFNNWKSDENGNPEIYTNIAEPNLNFDFTGSIIGPRTFSIPLSALVTTTGFDWTSTPVAQLLGHLHNPSSTNPDRVLNPAVWPMDMRFTVVNVAAGGSFSGWTNYIQNGVGDRTYDCTSPAVSITSPANNATISATTPTTISVTATDAVGITKVEFIAGPTSSSISLKWADNNPPYSWSLDPALFTTADISITAKAFDKAGNTNTNSITVHKGTTPGLSVVLTANGSRGPITIDPSATSSTPVFQQNTIANTPSLAYQEGTHHWNLHDINGDSKLDWIGVFGINHLGGTDPTEEHEFLWYEYVAGGGWIKHLIDVGERIEVRSSPSPFDAIRFGGQDVFSFRNRMYTNRANGNDWSSPTPYATTAAGHDALVADINGDGKDDLVVVKSAEGHASPGPDPDPKKGPGVVAWFRQTSSLGTWDKFMIDPNMDALGIDNNVLYAGASEGGICDLDGDGNLDIVAAGRWYENPAPTFGSPPGTPWTIHWLTSNGLASGTPLIGQINNQWHALAVKTSCVDIDHDGDMDLVQAENDILPGQQTPAIAGGARVGWLENLGGGTFSTTVNWIKTGTLSGEPTFHDYHSLGVFDYDGDGDWDVVVADGNQPENDCEKIPSTCGNDTGKSIYVMENTKGLVGKPTAAFWTQHRIVPGGGSGAVCHQLKVGDVDNDGKLDMVCMGHKYKAVTGPDAPFIFYKNATVTGGVEMKWEITGTSSGCTADTDTAGGDAIWSGAKAYTPGTHTEVIKPTLATGNATYTLTCAPGAVASSVTINVKPVDPNINYPEPPSSAALAPLYAEMNYTLPNCPGTAPGGGASPVTTWSGLQNAAGAATNGDVICISGQLTGTPGKITFNKPNTSFVTVRSAGAIPSRRVKPTDTLTGGVSAPTGIQGGAIEIGPLAKRYRFVGLDITTARNVHGQALVPVGIATATPSCEWIHFDRNKIHGMPYSTPSTSTHIGIQLNGCRSIIVQRNSIYEIREGLASPGGGDNQAILCQYCQGPVVIQNNYLEASVENIMFGGGELFNVTENIVIRGNLFEKIPAQRTNLQFYCTKNLLEFKQGNKILIEGNIFRNSWSEICGGGQSYAIVLKSSTQCRTGYEKVHTSNLTIRYNKFDTFSDGITLGKTHAQCSAGGYPDPNKGIWDNQALGGNTFHVHDNTFQKWGQWSNYFGVSPNSQIVLFQISLPKPPEASGVGPGLPVWSAHRDTVDDITLENNTVVDFGVTASGDASPGKAWGSACMDVTGPNSTKSWCFEKGLTARNNVMPGKFGAQNSLLPVTKDEWTAYFTDSIITRNLGIGTSNGGQAGVLTSPNWAGPGSWQAVFQNYGAGNFNLAAPYNTAPYVGTDGQQLGANISTLENCVSTPSNVTPTDAEWDWNGTCPGITNVSVDLKSNNQSGSITIAPGTPVTNTWHVENSKNCIKCSMPSTGPASWSGTAAVPDGSQLISPGPTVETIYTVWCSPTAAAITCTNASATAGARSSTVNVHMDDPVCPGETKYSSPSSGSTNVSLTPTLVWRPATNAEQYDVFVGTTTTSMSLVGSNIKTQCPDPSTDKCFTIPTSAGLAYNTEYWWRIQAENTDCPTGTEGESPWSFTTLTAPDPKPDEPVYNAPLDGAIEVPRPVTISWQPAANARTYDIRGGPCITDEECASQPPLLTADFIGTSQTFPSLLPGTRYHWQIVAKNNNPSPTPGDVWSFTTKFDIACTPIL